MKQFRMNFSKLAALLLTLSISATSMPAFAAATSTTTQSPTLSFTSGDSGDPNRATIITGDSIGIQESNVTGYVPQDIFIKDGEDENAAQVTEGFTVSSKHDSITVDPAFNPNTSTKDGSVNTQLSAEKTYVVQGNYYALLATGTVIETTAQDVVNSSIVESTKQNAITTYSSCTLTCTQAETESTNPVFSISDGTGAFASLGDGKNVTVAVVSSSKDASKQKDVVLNIINGKVEEFEIVLHPQQTYSYKTVDQGKPEDRGEPTEPLEYKTEKDNYIRMGTEFKIVFQMPQSNQVFLTVMTPQKAMDNIEGQITASNGEENANFIVLEDGDSLDYITDNFSVRRVSNQFNGKFTVQWEWIPQKVDNTPIGEDDPQWEDAQNAVQLSDSNSEMQRVTINPLEDDVTGILQATVSYIKPDGTSQTTATAGDKNNLPQKIITIKGSGTPVGVSRVSKTAVGEDGKLETTPEKVDLQPNSTMKLELDAYQGQVTDSQVNPKAPYAYTFELDMGAKNGAAQYATITATGDTDAVSIQVRDDAAAYVLGDQINNKNMAAGNASIVDKVPVTISANRIPKDTGTRTVKLTFHFYILDRNGKAVESPRKYEVTLTVSDSTPSQDSSLKSLVIKDQTGKVIDFPFSPDKTSYTGTTDTIHLPYKVESITLTPTMNDPRGADKDIIVTALDSSGHEAAIFGGKSQMEVQSGSTSEEIEFATPNQLYSILIHVPAQDPGKEYVTEYQLDIIRDPASTDNTLGSLGLYYPDDTAMKTNLVQNFDPETEEYSVEVAYSTPRLLIQATPNNSAAQKVDITSDPNGSGQGEGTYGVTQDKTGRYWLEGVPDLFMGNTNHTIELTIIVTAEDGSTKTYKVTLTRALPNNDASLKTMEVQDKDKQTLTYDPSLNEEDDTYTLEIPYATDAIKLKLTPTDENVNDILVYSKSMDSDPILRLQDGSLKIGAVTPAIDILAMNDAQIRDKGYHSIWIKVIAEDENTTKTYELRVTRAEPNTDATLKSLTVQDQDGTAIKTLAFHPDETSYTLTVPYETTGVSFTPTANYGGATIQIQQKGAIGSLPSTVPSGNTSKVFQLDDPGKERAFEITVTAEDGKTQKTYTLRFTREQPSSDARLKGLKVQNVDEFTPVFVSNKTSYDAIVTEGAPGVIITATANHPGATIRIDGIVVTSGQPSDLIELIEVEQDVQIEVTAQDGVTKEVYTIHFTNQNLIEKTSNADLRQLTINYGLMTPNFKAAITEYEVTVTEDTYSVDIIPKADDPLAEVHVFAGTREIGDYDGAYAEALEDGENPISVQVTSPDKTVTKTYTVNVYRNEEDKLKNLTPLEAEDIDFENSDDVILVMIDEYPRVGASVFNELRNYPEKTIIFQGNDYSLEFKASDLDRVIPQTEIYDFRMSFTSPDEDAIYDHIWDYSRNDDIDNRVVMLYFEQHTSLPGPATLHVSLGSRYADDTLYWHYYNLERDRIDYYGSLQSNSKGNIAVRIDHFSTYLITPRHRIAGSADQQGVIDELGQTSNGGDSLDQSSGSKPFPNTGAGRNS